MGNRRELWRLRANCPGFLLLLIWKCGQRRDCPSRPAQRLPPTRVVLDFKNSACSQNVTLPLAATVFGNCCCYYMSPLWKRALSFCHCSRHTLLRLHLQSVSAGVYHLISGPRIGYLALLTCRLTWVCSVIIGPFLISFSLLAQL